MHFSALVKPPFQVEWARPSYKAKSQGPLRREVWTRSMVPSAWSSLTLIRLQCSMIDCGVGQVCGWVQTCTGEKKHIKWQILIPMRCSRHELCGCQCVRLVAHHQILQWYSNTALYIFKLKPFPPQVIYWAIGIVKACWKVGDPTTKKAKQTGKEENFQS